MADSNTTIVNVKWDKNTGLRQYREYSNTTIVNVKFSAATKFIPF